MLGFMLTCAADRTQAEFFIENARIVHGDGALEALRKRLQNESARPHGKALKLAIAMLEREARRGRRHF